MMTHDAIVLRALRFAGAAERYCAWAAFGSPGFGDPAQSAGRAFTLLCDVLATGAKLPEEDGSGGGAVALPRAETERAVEREVARFVYTVTSEIQESDGGIPEREVVEGLRTGLVQIWKDLEGGLAAIDHDRLDDAVAHWTSRRHSWLPAAAEALSCLTRLTTVAPCEWPASPER